MREDPTDKSTEEAEIEFQEEINGVGRSSVLQLKRAGYTSLSDFRGKSQEDLIQINTIGPTLAERILSYAEKKGFAGISVESSNTTNDTEDLTQLSLSQLKTRLEKYYKPDEDESNWYRCRRTNENGSACNSKIYFSNKNPDDLRRHEKSHSTHPPVKEPSRSKETESTEKETSKKEQTGVEILEQLENEFEDI